MGVVYAPYAIYGDSFYFNDSGVLIGENSADVALWLAAHPGYRSNIWFSFGDGSEDMAVDELFYDEAIADFLEQIACADEIDPAFRQHAMDWLKPDDIKRGIETMLARLGPSWLTDAQIADVLLDAQARQRDHDAAAAESRAFYARVKP